MWRAFWWLHGRDGSLLAFPATDAGRADYGQQSRAVIRLSRAVAPDVIAQALRSTAAEPGAVTNPHEWPASGLFTSKTVAAQSFHHVICE